MSRSPKAPLSVDSKTAATNLQSQSPPHAIEEQESEDKLGATIRLDGLNL